MQIVVDNYIVLIDDEDFPLINGKKLSVREPYPGYKYVTCDGELLHRVLTKAPKNLMVDHKNGNGLDNRQSVNLRFATNCQNQMNTKKTRGVSKYRNVTWSKKAKKWQARISVNGKRFQIGHFDSELEAANLVLMHVKKYHGEFGNLNLENENEY